MSSVKRQMAASCPPFTCCCFNRQMYFHQDKCLLFRCGLQTSEKCTETCTNYHGTVALPHRETRCTGVYVRVARPPRFSWSGAKYIKSFFNQNIFQVTTWKGNLCRRIGCGGKMFAASSDSLSLSLMWFVISANSHLLSCQSTEPWLWLRDLLSHFAVSLAMWPASGFRNTTSVS